MNRKASLGMMQTYDDMNKFGFEVRGKKMKVVVQLQVTLAGRFHKLFLNNRLLYTMGPKLSYNPYSKERMVY